jgi:hypothetical protein
MTHGASRFPGLSPSQPTALEKAQVLRFLAGLQGHGLVAGTLTQILKHCSKRFCPFPHLPSLGNFDLGPSPGQGCDLAFYLLHRVSEPAKAASSDACPGPGI